MSGADILVEALEREGVDTIFAYPGGASHGTCTRRSRASKKIRTYLPRHEQGGVFAAEGYARATGKAGVCMATSGPGATNLVTGIADAFLDSTPLVAITGQVPQHMIGKGAFQETDVFSRDRADREAQLPRHGRERPAARIVKEAFYIAQTGRPGPGADRYSEEHPDGQDAAGFPERGEAARLQPGGACGDAELNELIGLIRQAKQADDLLRRRHHLAARRIAELLRVRRAHADSRGDAR